MSGPRLSSKEQKEIERCLKSSISKMEYAVYKKATGMFKNDLSLFVFRNIDKPRISRAVLEVLGKIKYILSNVNIIVSSEHLKLLLTEEQIVILQKNKSIDPAIDIFSFDEEPFKKIMGCTLDLFPFPIEFLGQGMFGMVFLIVYEGVKRALKVSFRQEYMATANYQMEWNNECEMAKKAGEIGIGPRVLQCKTCPPIKKGSMADRGYLLQEYIEGKTLDQTPLTKQLIFRVLDAYEDLLKAGIVHEDPNTENIMISPKDKVRFIDFGQSSVLKNKEDLEKHMIGFVLLMKEYIVEEREEDVLWVPEWINNHSQYSKEYNRYV